MDKTYAAVRGEGPIDWHKAIDQLECGAFNDANRHSLIIKAFRWVSCACGNQCAIIPRSNEPNTAGRPLDEELEKLGLHFPNALETGDYDAARATLAAIEARAAVLIQEELAKLNP